MRAPERVILCGGARRGKRRGVGGGERAAQVASLECDLSLIGSSGRGRGDLRRPPRRDHCGLTVFRYAKITVEFENTE